jgi:hypothetical protein
MRIDSMPIAVLMQRRIIHHPWADSAWAAVGVVCDNGTCKEARIIRGQDGTDCVLVPGLALELFADENDGYFENWAAPEPKVFVMWRLEGEHPVPVLTSVSYGEGTRMFDSGEQADGVPMPADVHAWLGHYLHRHYQPRRTGVTGGRQHHG